MIENKLIDKLRRGFYTSQQIFKPSIAREIIEIMNRAIKSYSDQIKLDYTTYSYFKPVLQPKTFILIDNGQAQHTD